MGSEGLLPIGAPIIGSGTLRYGSGGVLGGLPPKAAEGDALLALKLAAAQTEAELLRQTCAEQSTTIARLEGVYGASRRGSRRGETGGGERGLDWPKRGSVPFHISVQILPENCRHFFDSIPPPSSLSLSSQSEKGPGLGEKKATDNRRLKFFFSFFILQYLKSEILCIYNLI